MDKLDKHKAHDIIHQWNGGMAENCPSCNGSMTDADMMSEAKKIATSNFKPKANPMIPYDQRLQSYDEKKEDKEDDENPEKIIPGQKELGKSSFRSLIHFAESADAIPTRIKVIPIGKYKMNNYGEVNITKGMIQEMKKNFENGVRAGGSKAGLPIDIEHGTTAHKDAAAGWIKNLEVADDGGYATVEWTALGKQLLKDKVYKFYSPEYWLDYTDPENTDIKLKNVMTGGGLVNKPMIKHDLNPIVNSEKNLTNDENRLTIFLELEKDSKNKMNLSEIIKKAANERSSEEQKFVVDHKDQLTFAEAKAEGFAEDKKVEDKKEENQIKLEEGQVVVDKSKLDSLISLAEQGKSANDKLKKAELKEEVKSLVMSEKGSKLPTDQIDVAVNLLMSMSEDQAKAYKEQLKSLPEKQIFSETGTNNESATGGAVAEDLDKQIKKYAEDNKVDYATAASVIMKAEPVKLKEYQDSLPVAQQEK